MVIAALTCATAQAAGVPTQPGSPWPSMRHDSKNSGSSPLRARTRAGDRPWSFVTGKGVFSTPVVGPDETVYVGSADTYFYAVGRNGKLRWRFKTGEIIDSAAVLGRGGTVTFGSGDEYIYRALGEAPAEPDATDALALQGQPADRAGPAVNWWEGNVTMGPGGVLYAGNTGGAEYAINPDGRERWVFGTGNSVWSNAAIAGDGTVYFGSLDLFVYAVTADGRLRWQRPTVGFRDLLTGHRGRRNGLHRLLRQPAARARPGQRRRSLDLRDRRSRLRLPGPGRRHGLRGLGRRLGLWARRGAPGCAGATTPATRSARRPSSAASRRAPAGSSTWARRTACSMRSTPRPGAAAGPTTPRRGTPCCATATT